MCLTSVVVCVVPGADKKKPVTVLSFARRHTHNHIESLTFDEVTQLQKLLPDLEKQFAECEKTMAEDARAKVGRKQAPYVCRFCLALLRASRSIWRVWQMGPHESDEFAF